MHAALRLIFTMQKRIVGLPHHNSATYIILQAILECQGKITGSQESIFKIFPAMHTGRDKNSLFRNFRTKNCRQELSCRQKILLLYNFYTIKSPLTYPLYFFPFIFTWIRYHFAPDLSHVSQSIVTFVPRTRPNTRA